nr:MAG TPA: hypothetical protein [Caudoviricetes sp.]
MTMTDGYAMYDNTSFCLKDYTPALKMAKFEGLRNKFLLHKQGKAFLYFTIEHHASGSLGAYEVVKNGESAYFFELPKAIRYFNGEE